MGQVIEFRPSRAPASWALYGCARCGADLLNLFADGRVRCADCEQECPLRTVRMNGTGHEMNPNEHSNNRE
jgi:uncharacterized Zn finger protein (UPF0148 family)